MIQVLEDNKIQDIYWVMKEWFFMTYQERIEKNIFVVSSKGAIENLIQQDYEPLAVLFGKTVDDSLGILIEQLETNFPDIPKYQVNSIIRDEIIHETCMCLYGNVESFNDNNSDDMEQLARRVETRLTSETTDSQYSGRYKPEIRVAFRRKPLIPIKQFVENVDKLLILDGVSLKINIKNLYQMAAAMKIDGVIFTKKGKNFYSSDIINALGKLSTTVPWTVAEDWPGKDMDTLKECGFTLVAMALKEDSIRLGDDCLKKNKTAVILGYERDGLEDEVINSCDYTVMIPMSHGVDSLNVACAGIIAMWELFRK